MGRPVRVACITSTMPHTHPGVRPLRTSHVTQIVYFMYGGTYTVASDLQESGATMAGKALSYSLILSLENHTAFFWATL